MMRAGQAVRGLTLVAAEVGSLLLLLRLDLPAVDWAQPAQWLDRATPEDAVIALVRLAGLVTAGYLVATTALYVLATLTRVPTLIRGTSALTLPGVRRIVDGALAAAIVVAPATLAFGTGSASAQSAPSPAHAYAPSPAGDSGPRYTPTPAGGLTTAGDTSLYIVSPGDSLWSIAEEHLATQRAAPHGAINDAEIAPFWHALVELNASTISSGDPDVIYPGESLRLPGS